MYKTKVLSTIVLIFFIASVSNALSIVYVDVNGPNDPGTGTFDDPFRRIQDAIDSADSNDIVEIGAGIYTGEGNYDLDPNGLAITIRSTDPNDANVVAATIIDPNGAGRGFYFHSGEDANCVVAGLLLRNGYVDGSGGGILCVGSSPMIKSCVIIDNSAVWGGGGVYFLNSESTIQNCIISGNSADTGGGIRCLLGNPFIANCTVSGNSAEYAGGGIYCFDSNALITNSIIWGNDKEQIYVASGEPVVAYSDIQDGWPGTGNIDFDPCFVSFDPNSGPNVWDFHLQSSYGRWDPNNESWAIDSNTSVCIDAGDPNSDYSAEPWPNGKRANSGAYGGTNQASKNGNIADFDISGAVNFVDFAEFSDKWLAQEACIEDLTKNGVVDFADLRVFVGNWLWQEE